VKVFTGKPAAGFFGLSSMEYLVYSTAFSSLFCVIVVLALGWERRGRLSRAEMISLFLSGACTAYIIPSGTLIYSLPVSIMIAMVLMRGSVIVASRIVDFILTQQGLSKKEIPWQEEIAVLLASGAVATKLFFPSSSESRFPLIGIIVLGIYFFAYLLRLYIMNRAKLQGIAGKQLDQRLYFGMEQIFASSVLFGIAIPLFLFARNASHLPPMLEGFVRAVESPNPHWASAAVSGLPYALIAFLSVFLFLYPGKSATFTGVLNRLVSLIGGTTSTLAFGLIFSGGLPSADDFISLILICAAISFLAWGDRVEHLRLHHA